MGFLSTEPLWEEYGSKGMENLPLKSGDHLQCQSWDVHEEFLGTFCSTIAGIRISY